MSSSSAAISVRNLGVRFGARFGGRAVLERLDLELERGSVTALVGANGAGKSTLLRVLVGALVPDTGWARVLGLDPARAGARVRARVGYVPDRFDVSERTTAREWLEFVARFYPTWNRVEQQRLCELMTLDVAPRVAELSKGQRTKLALVAALAHEPELLLLDEPFSGLDVATRRAVASAVIGHLREQARTVLLVSHSMTDLERVADRVALLEAGRIVQHGELEPFTAHPRGGIDLEAALLGAEQEARS
jgi:ABC-2 type transport system ATP-binding protein